MWPFEDKHTQMLEAIEDEKKRLKLSEQDLVELKEALEKAMEDANALRTSPNPQQRREGAVRYKQYNSWHNVVSRLLKEVREGRRRAA